MTPVNNYGYNYQTKAAYAQNSAQSSSVAEETDVVEQETQEVVKDTSKQDTFEKTPPPVNNTYKPDMDKVNELKGDLEGNIGAFKKMVQGLFEGQGSAISDFLNIDKATQLQAQQAIAEDGEWGVNAVAGRILDMAKALSGGDPSKIDTLRNAVMKGFGEAEKVWGGSLPEISYQTKAKVMEGFDEWAKESNKA